MVNGCRRSVAAPTHTMARWLLSHHSKSKLKLEQAWFSAQRVVKLSLSFQNANRITGCSTTDSHPLMLSSSSPSSSSTSTTATADTISATAENLHAKILNSPPQAFFPWRHDINPLQSVVYNPLGGKLTKPTWRDWIVVDVITNMVAVGGLGVPWYKAFAHSWRHDLANSAAFAFSQSVDAVLTSSYRIPWNSDASSTATDEELFVSFDSTKSTNGGNDHPDGKTEHAGADNNEYPNVEDMLDERLVRQYQAAHEYGRDHIRVKLQMRPTSAHLHNLFGIPFLTREEVRHNPSLQDKYSSFLLSMTGVGTYQIIQAANKWLEHMMIEQMERRSEPIVSTTLMAQVLVHCDEVFSVHDIHTGMLLQGDADGAFHPVIHLVRLEMVIEYNLETSEWQQGHWIITDWDEILEGNIWFL